MKKHKQLVLLIVCAIVVTLSSGCIHFTDNGVEIGDVNASQYKDVNTVYVVKEVHAGHAEGLDFVTVYYYDGNQTKSINNDNRPRSSGYETQIDVYNTNDAVGHLVYVKTFGDYHAVNNNQPHDVYQLYMPVNMSFIGTDSTYRISSGRSTKEVQSIMS